MDGSVLSARPRALYSTRPSPTQGPHCYYVQAGWHLYAFSLSGRKIDFMPDEIGRKRERDHAWLLLSKPTGWWEPGSRPILSEIFFRIVDWMSKRERHRIKVTARRIRRRRGNLRQ